MQTANRPSAGLPPRLKLFIVELAGIALMGAGCRALLLGPIVLGLPLGLSLVLAGANLLLDPAGRRKTLERVLLKLLDRWRAPPMS